MGRGLKLPGSVHHIYDYLCVQTESCGFIINGVIVKDEENANYYPARRYSESLISNVHHLIENN